MSNPADQAISDLIETLCNQVVRCSFDSDAAKKQKLIDQIAQLRASMNPVIVQKKSKS